MPRNRAEPMQKASGTLPKPRNTRDSAVICRQIGYPGRSGSARHRWGTGDCPRPGATRNHPPGRWQRPVCVCRVLRPWNRERPHLCRLPPKMKSHQEHRRASLDLTAPLPTHNCQDPGVLFLARCPLPINRTESVRKLPEDLDQEDAGSSVSVWSSSGAWTGCIGSLI